jgi:hypothetical protein
MSIEKTEIKKLEKSFFVKKQENEKTKHYEYVIEGEFDENHLLNVKLEVYYYPLYPYGNYIKSVLEIKRYGDVIQFNRYDVRMNWNGTGRDDAGYIEIYDIFEETPFFLNKDYYEEIDSPEKFEEKVKDILDFLKDYVDMMKILE